MGILPEHLMGTAALEREMDRRGIAGAARDAVLAAPVGDRAAARSARARSASCAGSSDELIELTRYDDYWNGTRGVRAGLLSASIPDPVTQELEFRRGAVDTYSGMPHQAARYREDPRYRAVSTVTNTYSYIAYNLRKPLFQDVRVRRALGMAIDVDQL